jgi:hypothetical protein
MYIGLHVFIIFGFQWNLNYLDRCSKNTQISNLMKIRPVGAELFYADRQTDVTKLVVFFEILCTRLKTFMGFSFCRSQTSLWG